LTVKHSKWCPMNLHVPGKFLFLSVVFTFLLLNAVTAAGAEKTFLVGFAQDTLANDWRLAQVMDVARELEKDPSISFVYTDGLGRTAKQISDIENLLARGIDLLITSPRDQQAFIPVLKKVAQKGIPIVLLTRKIQGDYFTTFIHPDDRLIASQAAVFIAEKLQGKGKILVLQGVPTATTAIARTEGFVAEIAHYDGLEIVAVKTANYLRNDAIRAIEEAIAEGITFDALYAQSDSMAIGARMALEKAGIAPETIVIVGIDYINQARQAIREGEQNGSFIYPTCGKEGARYALKILQGEKVPRELVVPSLLITRDNVDAIEPIF